MSVKIKELDTSSLFSELNKKEQTNIGLDLLCVKSKAVFGNLEAAAINRDSQQACNMLTPFSSVFILV